jgi:aminoglycoside phosphotransferase (APT) family kinase protein
VIALAEDLVAWITAAAGGTLLAAERIPGGASREGWFVDIEIDGQVEPLFLRMDRHGTPEGSAFHSLWVEAEVFRALHETGVAVPRILAVHPRQEAFLAERIPGQTWFYRIKDPEEQVRVAQDFIRNLATLHRLDPAALDLPSFQKVTSCGDAAHEELRRMRRRATGPDGTIDPLMAVCLDWLERNVPDYQGPVVLVQGDTGPGNFLYEDGHVTALVDWELAHFGDPMDDIAWLSLRTAQDTFTYLPDRLTEYERLSGHSIDPARVWYYRLFAETRLTTSSRGAAGGAAGRAARPEAPRDPGNGLIYGMLHRRLTLEALGRVAGIDLGPVTMPPDGAPEEHHYIYDSCLAALEAVVPRIDDPLGSQWSKGVARAIKYLKEIDLSGPAFAAAELDDLAGLLGYRPESVRAGRVAVAERVHTGTVDDERYIRYQWRQVQRDDYLMREASGALRHRAWPPLTRDGEG